MGAMLGVEALSDRKNRVRIIEKGIRCIRFDHRTSSNGILFWSKEKVLGAGGLHTSCYGFLFLFSNIVLIS